MQKKIVSLEKILFQTDSINSWCDGERQEAGQDKTREYVDFYLIIQDQMISFICSG